MLGSRDLSQISDKKKKKKPCQVVGQDQTALILKEGIPLNLLQQCEYLDGNIIRLKIQIKYQLALMFYICQRKVWIKDNFLLSVSGKKLQNCEVEKIMVHIWTQRTYSYSRETHFKRSRSIHREPEIKWESSRYPDLKESTESESKYIWKRTKVQKQKLGLRRTSKGNKGLIREAM